MSKAAELANLIGNINAGGGGVNRNVIGNGAMTCSQRGTSFNQPADGAYTLDRFSVFRNGEGIMDVEQSTTVPSGEGFKNSLKCTVDTVDTSLDSNDFGGLGTKVEGQDLARFNFGQATAKQFVFSFFVRSNITGTYSVSFRNGSANRYLVKEYTISSADTWQKITITNLADTTGTWATDNTTGLDIRFCLWSDGDFDASAGSWATGNIIGSSSNVNWATSTSNSFYLTGVQLEVGQNPIEFEHEPYEKTISKCQRYYYRYSCDGTHDGVYTVGNATTNDDAIAVIATPVGMRAEPSFGFQTGSGGSRVRTGSGSSQQVSAMSIIGFSNDQQGNKFQISATTTTTNLTAGDAAQFRVSTDDFIDLDSEL